MSELARRARRARSWLEERLLRPEYPLVAVEVRPRSLGVVRLVRDGDRLALGAAASLELPEGALQVSMTQPNVIDAEAFGRVLRSVLERAGILGASKVGVVLPDPIARVALMPARELRPAGGASVEDLIRFRLRKSVPFEIREARLAHRPGGPRDEDMALVAAIYGPVLESYEAAFSALGLRAGRIELAGLAILDAVEAGRPPADRLLVNWDDGYVSLILTRGGLPVLVRTLSGEAVAVPDHVVREAANTVLYYREKLEGAGLAAVVLRSGALPAEEAAVLLTDAVGLRPEILNPWGPLEAPGGGVSQLLAGAAASLTGRAA